MNSRLDELQAAILRAKLPHLDARNRRRRAIAAAYDAALSAGQSSAPARRPGAEHVYHQYVIRAADRPLFQARFREAGIGTAIHYPVPIHQQRSYADRVTVGPSGCRATEIAAGEIVSLPIFPELSDAQVERVCSALRRWCE